MKNISILLVLLVAFLTFTAQNCSNRDPREEIGTKGKPIVVGSDQYGKIIIAVKPGTIASNSVAGAKVYMGLSADSLTNKQYQAMIITTPDSSGNPFAVFDGLIPQKTYFFNSTYTTGGQDYKTQSDTSFKCLGPKNPVRVTLVVE